MERLTETFEESGEKFACLPECKVSCIYGLTKENSGCRCDKFAKILDRLAAIEDILGDDYDLDRLKELVEADREGRCVVLPCKVGEPIWEVLDVCEFPGDCHATQTCKGCEYREVFKEKLALTLYMLSESGKLEPPYYASEKEAESELERMKEGDRNERYEKTKNFPRN